MLKAGERQKIARSSSSEQWRPITYRRGPSPVSPTSAPRGVAVAGKVVEQNDPKTKAGKRPIPLGPHLVAMLRTAKARQGAEKLLAGEAYSDGGYVAADELGRPLAPAISQSASSNRPNRPVYRRCGCTIAGTPRPASCWRTGSQSNSSPSSSGIVRPWSP